MPKRRVEWDKSGNVYSAQYGSFKLTVTKEITHMGIRWVGRIDLLRSASASTAEEAKRALLEMIELQDRP